MKRLPVALVALALVWIAALLQRGISLGWDEVEFFRATRWVGEGRVPFRDFWEHHTPLQWFLFAPIARFFANDPGAASVIAMRWAQVPLWIAAMVLLLRIARSAGAGPSARWTALAALLASSSFVRKAVEYRVDTVGNALYVAGIALLLCPRFMWRRLSVGASRTDPAANAQTESPGHNEPAGPQTESLGYTMWPRLSVGGWLAFSVIMSAAVLANMRLAPLVILTAAIASFWDAAGWRWRFQPRALAMTGGVLAVAGIYFAYVYATGSMSQIMEDLIRYNVAPGRERLQVSTFGVTLLVPVWSRDIPAVVLWLLALGGTVFALRDVPRPGSLQFTAILFLLSLVTVRILEVHYEYHFQTAYLLMLPLAAAALERSKPLWRNVALAAIAVGLLVNAAWTVPGFGKALDYQDRLMTDADRLTRPDERVFDGVGFALRREPAYRYWFLPTGLRWMAAERLVAPYDARQLAADPPAAVGFDFRVYRWTEIFPALGAYATRHYVPLYRDLWIPGLTATIGAKPARFLWTAPRAGRYRMWSSEVLPKHPWFRQPLRYATIPGPLAARYAIPLERLPYAQNATLQWTVDGVPVPSGTRTIDVRKGARVELYALNPAGPAGVLLVPEGITTLCIGPEEEPGR